MIANDGLTDLGWWFREHSKDFPCQSEVVLYPSLSLLRIARSHADLIRLQVKGAELGALLDHVETQHEQWQLDWIDPYNRMYCCLRDTVCTVKLNMQLASLISRPHRKPL
jgi:hypothetical protein